MVATSWHWRRLLIAIGGLMLLGFAAPRLFAPPEVHENRRLAEWPAWPRTPAGFKAFRQGVDAYVADRFPARPHLIGVLNLARLWVGDSGSERVIVGRRGWLFYDNGEHLGAAHDEFLPAEEARQSLAGLAGRTERLRGMNVPYIVLSAPQKEAVYPQYGPYWHPGPDPDRPAKLLAAMAQAAGAGEILDLQAAVSAVAEGGGKAFSRHDTHWTGRGAYAAYVVLMNRLHALGVTGPPRPFSAFSRADLGEAEPRDLALMLGVASFVDVDYAQYEDPAVQARLRLTYLSSLHDWVAPQVVDTGQAGRPVLLMTRDSFSRALLPYLYGHFSRIVLAHNQDGSWRPDLMERFQPDVVVLEVVEGGLPHVLAPGPSASPEAMARIDRTIDAYARQMLFGPRQAPGLTPIDPRLRRALDQAAPARCNLEEASLRRDRLGAVFAVGGWISELTAEPASPEGYVRLRGPAVDDVAKLAVDGARPDVAAFFKAPGAEASGFRAFFRPARLPAGDYRVTVYRRAAAGWIACEASQAVAFRQAAAPVPNIASIAAAE